MAQLNKRWATRMLSATLLFGAVVSGCTKQSHFVQGGGPPDPVVEMSVMPELEDASMSDQSVDAAGVVQPINYIVVIIKENRTFDNLFATFPGADGVLTAQLSTGSVINRPLAPNGVLPRDLCHTHSCALTAYRNGTMTGFDLNPYANPPSGSPDYLPFAYHSQSQIPNYWAYASNFVLCDHFFTISMAPSFPGHFSAWVAQSPAYSNPVCGQSPCGGPGCLSTNSTISIFDPDTCAKSVARPCFNIPSIIDALPAGITWATYGGAGYSSFVQSLASQPDHATHVRPESAFLPDVTANRLPNLVYLHIENALSEHPPEAICPGENYTVTLINALMSNPHWNEMAIIFTYDDWGGFFDHVAPPGVKQCANGEAFMPGFRVPAMVISPYAKTGYILKTPTEMSSIPRLIEDLWGMPRMAARDPHARDAMAGSLLEAFDFTQPPRPPFLLTPRTCP
jgi:phospholipase C